MTKPTKRMREGEKWNLRNLPPAGHPDVGPFMYRLCEESLRERDRLGLAERWLSNYILYRNLSGRALSSVLMLRPRSRLSLALLSSNINRTVASITAREPVCEIKTDDTGIQDGIDKIFDAKVKEWNAHDFLDKTLTRTALNMEVYGTAVEKYVYDTATDRPKTVVVDNYSVLVAPGYYSDISMQAPYIAHVHAMDIDEIEAKFGVEGKVVETEVNASILGEERKDERSFAGTRMGSINAAGNYVPTTHPRPEDSVIVRRALVFELWIRDYSTIDVVDKDSPIPYDSVDEYLESLSSEDKAAFLVQMESGINPEIPPKGYNKKTIYKYPGNIRKVTITNNGNLVLDDLENPNINMALPEIYVKNCFLYNRLPFGFANSYEDTDSIWGFSQAELVGDINLAIDELWSDIVSYLRMTLFPPLILPQDTRVPRNSIRYLPRLVIEPVSKSVADGIKWLQLPTPPTWLFQALQVLISFFDRISQIEGADRGENNKSVIAASAIQMLQERGAILVQAKVRNIDRMVKFRGEAYISLYTNFSTRREEVKVEEDTPVVRGVDLVAYKLRFNVEAGSTVAKTPSQSAEQSMRLYEMKAIDRQALLEVLNFPEWRRVAERMGESELDVALNILVQAGLDENQALQLRNLLMQPQTGPQPSGQGAQAGGQQNSARGKAGAPAKPGIPKASQGGDK